MAHDLYCFCPVCTGQVTQDDGLCWCEFCKGAERGWHSLQCSCPECQAEIDGRTIPGERTPLDDLCHLVTASIAELTEQVKLKGDRPTMNVAKYRNSGGDFPDPLPPSAIGKKAGDKGKGKVLAVREVESKKRNKKTGEFFSGLALDVKVKGTKYSFLTSYERYDIGAIINQLDEEDTDDWLGREVIFVLRKAKTGKKLFVNAWNPKSKRS